MVDPGAVPLLGRQREIDVIADSLEEARAGRVSLVLVEGAAGIGKSRLLADAVRRGQALGFAVGDTAADELEQTRPFSLLARALDLAPSSTDPRRQRAAERIGPDVAARRYSPHDPSGLYVGQEALLDLVDSLCGERPLALVVDDLHWADASSLAVLGALGRHLGDQPLAIVGAYRPAPRPLQLDRLIAGSRVGGRAELRLEPLHHDDVVRLAENHLAGRAGTTLRTMLGSALGSPFLALDLLRGLEARQAIHRTGETIEIDPGLPPRFEHSILQRVGALGPGAAELVRVAAVYGTGFTIDDLAAVAGRPPVGLHDPLVEVLRSGLLVEVHDRLGFPHDLVREAVYHAIPAPIRLSLHRQVAAALQSAGEADAAIAPHLARGAAPGDLGAIRTLEQRATALARLDPRAALDLLERAAELAGEGAVRRSLDARRVPILAGVGELASAEALARETLGQRPDEATEAELQIGLAETLLLAGDARQAVELLEQAATCTALDRHRRAQLVADLASARLSTYDVEGAARDAARACELGERLGDRGLVAAGLGVRCRLAAFAGDMDLAISLGQQAVATAGSEAGSVRRLPHFYLGLALLNGDRAEEAIVVLAEGLRRAENQGIPWGVAQLHNALIMGGFHSGAWENATAEAEAGRQLHLDAGTRAGYIQLESMLGLIAFHQGQYGQAQEARDRAEHDFSVPGHDAGGVIWLLWLQACLDELAGDLGAAAGKMKIALDLAMQLKVHSVKIWFGPESVRLLLAAGRTDQAAELAGAIGEVADQTSLVSARAAALRCRGLLDDDAALLGSAAELYRRTSRRFDLALTCEQAGDALARLGRLTEAVAAYEDALRLCREMDAAHVARRVAAGLRRAGVTSGTSASRGRPPAGIEALTPTERQVLVLVGEGLRNPEIAERMFISRRTVETHVGRIYRKLDVKGRVALARQAARLQP
jgi:DNA-binding CsgD family transcriptional regulator